MWLREAGWTEQRAQVTIAANSMLLGIPKSWRVQQERAHGGGRPDVFFSSPDGEALLVAELQLGGVDPYHITKCAEYLAREQRSSPAATCRCALVAESFDGRYGRLAEALVRIAPVELFRMHVEIAGSNETLVVRPHEPTPLSEIPIEDETREAEWRASPWYPLAEDLLGEIERIDPAWSPRFNGQYIAGQRFGGACNSVAVRRDGSGFQIELKLEQSAATDGALEAAGFGVDYRNDREHTGIRRRHYRVRVGVGCKVDDLAPLRELVRQAHQRWKDLDLQE